MGKPSGEEPFWLKSWSWRSWRMSGDKDLAIELENKGYDWIRPEVAA